VADGWTVKKGTIERYDVHGPHGMWAIVTLDPRGVFQAVSDVGDYAYAGWGHHGCESFKHFLVGLRDHDYFLSKVTRERGREFAFDKTVKEIRHRIVDGRRDGGLTRRQARDAWDDLEEIAGDHTYDATYFVHLVMERDALYHALGDDPCEIPRCEEWSAWGVRFFNEIFREQLVPALKAELEAEAAHAA
jgi:hypothetical protein